MVMWDGGVSEDEIVVGGDDEGKDVFALLMMMVMVMDSHSENDGDGW